MATALEVCQVDAGYAGKQVLFGAELAVEAGEIVGIIGPNGSGKSTLLKSIFGVTRPWAGDVRLHDRPIVGWSPLRKVKEGLGLVVQGGQAFDDLTVRDNLMLGGQAFMSRRALDARIAELEERFEILRERRGQLAHKLSGGERQQLALARSLVARPTVLLLDEPSLGLSPLKVQEAFAVIAGLRDEGLTLVIVEQNVGAVLGVADRLAIMREGAVVAEAAPDEFLASEDLVETFLGSNWVGQDDGLPAGGRGK